MEKFIILCRYEHWTDSGKIWSKWYIKSSPMTLKEATKEIESLKTKCAQTDKVTKLKHEFKTIPVKNIKNIN